MDEVVELVRKLKRASQGLSLDEDAFQGLINIKDIRERTRLGERNIYRHSYMRLLAKYGGEEWEIMEAWAIMEEHLFIAQDGEQRREAIQMLARKQEQPNVAISMAQPQPQTIEPKPEEKKKGLFHRG